MQVENKPKLLSVARKGELVEGCEEAFGKAGFVVESAVSGKQAIALIERRRYDVLLVNPGVEEEERNRIAVAFKRKNGGGRVVFLYDGSIRKAEMADALLSVTNEPAELARTICKHMGRGSAAG